MKHQGAQRSVWFVTRPSATGQEERVRGNDELLVLHAQPYYFTFRSRPKPAWVGKRLESVYQEHFSTAFPPHYAGQAIACGRLALEHPAQTASSNPDTADRTTAAAGSFGLKQRHTAKRGRSVSFSGSVVAAAVTGGTTSATATTDGGGGDAETHRESGRVRLPSPAPPHTEPIHSPVVSADCSVVHTVHRHEPCLPFQRFIALLEPEVSVTADATATVLSSVSLSEASVGEGDTAPLETQLSRYCQCGALGKRVRHLVKEGLFVVNKPPFMPVHGSGKFNRNTLLSLLKAYSYRSQQQQHRQDNCREADEQTPAKTSSSLLDVVDEATLAEVEDGAALYACHRLDMGTSGVMIYARDTWSSQVINAIFQGQPSSVQQQRQDPLPPSGSATQPSASAGGRVGGKTEGTGKVYLARVAGKFPVCDEGCHDGARKEFSHQHQGGDGYIECSAPIGCVDSQRNLYGWPHQQSPSSFSPTVGRTRDDGGGGADGEETAVDDDDAGKKGKFKPARTLFKCLRYDECTDESIVECRPVTGRTHQIRVHLQYLGHPIANDGKYRRPMGHTQRSGGGDGATKTGGSDVDTEKDSGGDWTRFLTTPARSDAEHQRGVIDLGTIVAGCTSTNDSSAVVGVDAELSSEEMVTVVPVAAVDDDPVCPDCRRIAMESSTSHEGRGDHQAAGGGQTAMGEVRQEAIYLHALEYQLVIPLSVMLSLGGEKRNDRKKQIPVAPSPMSPCALPPCSCSSVDTKTKTNTPLSSKQEQTSTNSPSATRTEREDESGKSVVLRYRTELPRWACSGE